MRLKSSEIEVPANAANRPLAARLVILLFLGVFCFQLARVFIVIDDCTHHGTSGYTFEHCKGMPDGLIVPAQLGAVSSPPVQEVLEATREILPSRSDVKLIPPVSSFFHP